MIVRWKLLLGLALVLALLILRFFRTFDESLSRVQHSGVIRVGYAAEAPYVFNLPDGSVAGEAQAIVGEVCRKLRITKIEWVQTSFDKLIPGLEEGRFDVVASGLFITPDRAERVLFSQPTFIARNGLLVQRGNPFKIKSITDVVTNEKVVIAVLDGAVEGAEMERAGVRRAQLMVVPDAATGRAAVQSQSAAGLALSAATVRWMAKENQDSLEFVVPFDSIATPMSVQQGALAFGPSAFKLRAAFDDCLKQFVGTNRHLELIQAFGFTATDMPSNRRSVTVLR